MPKVKIVNAPRPRSLRTDEVLEVGKSYEMSDADANRWIKRGVGEVVEEKAHAHPAKRESSAAKE